MNLLTKLRAALAAFSLLALVPLSAHAADRGPGFEFGADLIYLAEKTVNFDGGSTVTLDDDYSAALKFGYRLSGHFELGFALDWNEVDYRANVRSNNPLVSGAYSGTMESFIPRIDLTFNVYDGAFTPYISANVGWAFVDTNIPTSLAQTYCWWDPWYGYICNTYQETKTTDSFVYGGGFGLRWDAGDSLTLRLGYNKQFMDVGQESSTGMDQIRLGVLFRY